MEGLIALYIVYFLWKSTVEAAVNILALAKGKPVGGGGAKTEGEEHGRYFSRGLGTIVGALLWALSEGVRTGWTAASTKYGPSLEEARARRRAKWRTPPADAPSEPPADGGGGDEEYCCARCGADLGAGDREYRWVPGEGLLCAFHPDDEADDDPGWRCARCGRDLEAYATQGMSIGFVLGEGDVCSAHLDSHCAACGHPPRPDDPLVLDGKRVWIHRSHRRPPTDDEGEAPVCPACHQAIGYGEANVGADGAVVHMWCRCATCRRPGTDDDPLVADAGWSYVHRSHLATEESVADVADADGREVPAVWELGPARAWETAHPTP